MVRADGVASLAVCGAIRLALLAESIDTALRRSAWGASDGVALLAVRGRGCFAVKVTRGAAVGGVIVAGFVLAGVFAPLLCAGVDPLAQHVGTGAVAPSMQHLFGTDRLGRDVLARMLYGARVSLRVAFLSVALAALLGTALGIVAGYARGGTDAVIMSATDVALAFPSIVLAIAIAVILGPSVETLVLAIGLVYVPQYARLARGAVLSVTAREYVEAARALGARAPRIIAVHVLPNILPPLIAQATLGLATAELEAAGLSYLGLGAAPPTPEWGAMLGDARDYWLSAPWALLFPGAAITTLAAGFNLLGDGAGDRLGARAG